MKLVRIPTCNCTPPYDRIIAITESGAVYCASCQTKGRAERPHVFDVPAELTEIVDAITNVADLNIKETRQYNSGGFNSDQPTVRIIAKTRDFSGECVIQWHPEKFPVERVRVECNHLRGKKIDLRKLPTAITPQVRKFLELLQRYNFVATDIRHGDRNTQKMYLERWFGPSVPDGVKHVKLVVRVELALSMDVADGIGRALGALSSFVTGKPIPLPYADAARGPLEASQEVNFAMPSMCVGLLNAAYEYAIAKLAAFHPDMAGHLLEKFPEMAAAIERGHQVAMAGNPQTWSYSCDEKTGLWNVCAYAQYHQRVIADRINGVVANGDELPGLPERARSEGEPEPLTKRPPRIEELSLDKGAREVAKPHYDFIDAIYSLFLRIPAQVIKMETASSWVTSN